MRKSIRLLGLTAATAALLAVGSPAFAGGSDDDSKVTSSAEGGKGEGGKGGLGVNVLSGIGVLGDGTASAGDGGDGAGGDASSNASDDSNN